MNFFQRYEETKDSIQEIIANYSSSELGTKIPVDFPGLPEGVTRDFIARDKIIGREVDILVFYDPSLQRMLIDSGKGLNIVENVPTNSFNRSFVEKAVKGYTKPEGKLVAYMKLKDGELQSRRSVRYIDYRQ